MKNLGEEDMKQTKGSRRTIEKRGQCVIFTAKQSPLIFIVE